MRWQFKGDVTSAPPNFIFQRHCSCNEIPEERPDLLTSPLVDLENFFPFLPIFSQIILLAITPQ